MRWECLVITEPMNPSSLNELGADGWELVAVVSPGHIVPHHFFKRGVKA